MSPKRQRFARRLKVSKVIADMSTCLQIPPKEEHMKRICTFGSSKLEMILPMLHCHFGYKVVQVYRLSMQHLERTVLAP